MRVEGEEPCAVMNDVMGMMDMMGMLDMVKNGGRVCRRTSRAGITVSCHRPLVSDWREM